MTSVFKNLASLTRQRAMPTPDRWERTWSVATPSMGSIEPVIVDGIFYGLVEGGTFAPLDVSTGAPVWRAALPEAAQLPRGVAVDAETVLVALTRSMVAFRRIDGELLWQCETAPAAELGAPVVDGTRIIAGHRDRIVARSSSDGRERWSVSVATPDPFVQTEDRLIVPARDGVRLIDTETGKVVEQLDGAEFVLPVEGAEPTLLVSRGYRGLERLSLDGRSLDRIELASFLADAGPYGRLPLQLDRGATIAGRRLFGSDRGQHKWFWMDLDEGAGPSVEGGAKQYATFASSANHVFASDHQANEVDVFDHHLRRLGALSTGEKSLNFVTPGLFPTAGGLVVLSGTRVSFFGTPLSRALHPIAL